MFNKTFDEWKAKGYHVIKGQKASGRNAEGKATFTQKQVEQNIFHGDYDYEDDDQIADYIYDIGDR